MLQPAAGLRAAGDGGRPPDWLRKVPGCSPEETIHGWTIRANDSVQYFSRPGPASCCMLCCGDFIQQIVTLNLYAPLNSHGRGPWMSLTICCDRSGLGVSPPARRHGVRRGSVPVRASRPALVTRCSVTAGRPSRSGDGGGRGDTGKSSARTGSAAVRTELRAPPGRLSPAPVPLGRRRDVLRAVVRTVVRAVLHAVARAVFGAVLSRRAPVCSLLTCVSCSRGTCRPRRATGGQACLLAAALPNLRHWRRPSRNIARRALVRAAAAVAPDRRLRG